MIRSRNFQIFHETLIRNITGNGAGRLFHANVQKKGKMKMTLYSKISPLGNPSLMLTPELDQWIENGNKVHFDELQRIIRDLRKRGRFSQALEVSKWMDKRGICTLTPIERAVLLDLIGKVHGYLSAENYFNNLSDKDKTDKTYGALLHCYVRQRQTAKVFSHIQKMKEIGIKLSSLAYNDIMCLCTYIGQNEKVHDLLIEMKESGVSPDSLSYRICMNSYGERKDIEGMEKVLIEMENQTDMVMDWNTYAVVANFYIKADLRDKANTALKKSEEKLDRKNGGVAYNHLISLHTSLGNKNDVLRLWGLEKTSCKRCINRDYIAMLQSLLKLDELEEAEKLLQEWESSGNCYDFRVPYALIVGYIDRGLYDRAKTLLNDLAEKGKETTPDSWGRVATGFVQQGEVEKGLDCMKAALSLHVERKGLKLNPNVTATILNWLGEMGSLEDVESFVGLLRNVIPVNKRMYHTLLKAYIRNHKEVDILLDGMKADNITEDEETKKILALKQRNIVKTPGFGVSKGRRRCGVPKCFSITVTSFGRRCC